MSRLVAVVDCGAGNLRSVAQALRHEADADVDIVVGADPDTLRRADRVVLPGQGAMRDCMRALDAAPGLRDAVLEAARSKPLLGVCIGMQMLFDHSEEQDTPGLGLVPGTVRRFRLDGRLQPDGSRYKVPQMGWNGVVQRPHALWRGIPDGASFYFVHSYRALPADDGHTAGSTDYGGFFTSAVARDNIFATQFHPEKSAANGLALYRNFLRWSP